LLGGELGKVGVSRLGNENSEDALSWNVFLSLRETGKLGEAAAALVGSPGAIEPSLIVWGKAIEDGTLLPSAEVKAALDRLEPNTGSRPSRT